MAKPFVKWAGGKTQLLPIIRLRYPKTIKRYCEPFVGGGAVLFDVLTHFSPKEVLINDKNPELINTYFHIKKNVKKLIENLEEIQESYYKSADKKEYYLGKRERFNELIVSKENTIEKACLFIFLNKTCFNGLYRVNSKGLFNVPFNNSKQPLICDAKNLLNASNLLQDTEIICGDYSETFSFIDNNTFVYIDPPYRPLTDSSSFTSYSKDGFNDSDQIKLKQFVDLLSEKGAYFLLSNSDPKEIDNNDDFFDDLYVIYNIERIKASRMINSNATKRGLISELLVSNKSYCCEEKDRYEKKEF